MLNSDWTSLMRKFRDQYGKHLKEEDLPVQSYYEQFEESLADGCLQAERLTHVVSAREEKNQKALKPEPARQLGLHLDSTLTIQTNRRFMSNMPTTTEQFRAKYRVMSNCWLLAKLRQSGRHLYSDLIEMTFPRFCDELLSQKNFLLDKEFGPKRITAPDWDICMAYELEIRREAIRLATEEGFSIERAWWAAYENDHHRMEHWQSFLGVKTGGSSSSANEDHQDKRIAQLEEKLGDLSRQVRNARSRSPRGNKKSQPQLSLPAPAHLALPAPPTPKGKSGKGKGKGKKNKSRGRGTATSQTVTSFQALMDLPRSQRPQFTAAEYSFPGVCYAFQSNTCTNSPCSRAHVCIGCGRANVGYNACKCLSV